MKPSVTIITPGSFPIPYHITSSVESSIMNMAPFLVKKLPVTVLGLKFPEVPLRKETGGVQFINFCSRSRLDYLSQIIRYIKRHPASIIQVENRPHFIERIKRNFPKAKVLLVIHSVTFLLPKSIKRERLIRAFRYADQIIVNSEFMRKYVEQIDKNAAKKIYVNYLGVDPKRFIARFDPEVEEWREEELKRMGLAGKKVILYVGRLLPNKGVHRLLESIKRIQPHFEDFVLLIVGGNGYGKNHKTPYVQNLYKLAEPYPEHVRFIPFVPMDEIDRWYRLADVLVTPSTGPEAFGLVNVEGMATGIPIVASDVGGIPEIVEDRKTGLLIPLKKHVDGLADALVEILTDEDLAEKLGKKGRKRVEKVYTWEKSADRLHHCYFNN
jgi:spore coat protein SA